MRTLFLILFTFSTCFSQLRFEEISSEYNFNHTFFSQTFGGAGLSFVDFDGDGLDDITIPVNQEKTVYFYKNLGNRLELIPVNIQINEDVKQVMWVDYDNDLDMDFYYSSYNGVNRLFENKGFLNFEEVTSKVGLPLVSNRSFGFSWADINNDGFLDLYQSTRDSDTTSNLAKIFISQSAKMFLDVSDDSGIEEKNKLPFCLSFFDINNDTYNDLYIANDKETGNSLYLNKKNGEFDDISSSSKTGFKINGMSVTVGDINNDTYLDIYSTNLDSSSLMLINNGDLTFSENADELGIGFNGIGWGAQFEDFDLDGYEDLYVSGGYEGSSVISSAFYFNLNGVDFRKDNSIGFIGDTVSSYGNAIGDINNDGHPDIAVLNQFPGKSFIFKNIYNGKNNWLKISLVGNKSNRDGFGTRVVVSSKNVKYTRTLLSTEGFISQNSKALFFGLGDSEKVDSINIYWPSGVIDKIYDPEINRQFEIIEGSSFYPPKILSSSEKLCESGFVTIKAAFDYPNYLWSSGDTTKEISVNSEGFYFLEVIDEEGMSQFSDTIYLENINNPLFEIEIKEITPQHTSSITVIGLDSLKNFYTSIDNGNYHLNKMTYRNLTSGEHSITVRNEFGCETTIFFDIINQLKGSINLPDTTHSIARKWIDILLESIRNDFARPPVHARNLFHISAMMYDIYSLFKSKIDNQNLSKNYLINQSFNDRIYSLNLDKLDIDDMSDIKYVISHACNHFIKERFKNSPSFTKTYRIIDSMMVTLDLDYTDFDQNYSNGELSSLGNYISNLYIKYGRLDNSNEENDYSNSYYNPVNEPLNLESSGNKDIKDPNRWQPLKIDGFIDQSGNPIEGIPEFISPEWGNVIPFALKSSDLSIKIREEDIYKVYHDPGPPPYLDTLNQGVSDSLFKRSFSMVSVWSSHLDRNDGVIWDISPNSIGNVSSYPQSVMEYEDFYNYYDGGDTGQGYDKNPITNEPYDEQFVPRGDYTRVLAEFWADGPESETPPGHWFVILNQVNDNKNLVRKFEGQGEELSSLEWDIKSYFLMGGAMHDAAISAWSIKGYYDYIRPVSAIRYFSEKNNESKNSIPIIESYIDVVEEDDSLFSDENIGKVKLFTWKGFSNPYEDINTERGSGWILAENWWPYQRPSFVTPPFAGYVSGHSTFSTAAATILEKLTGSEYFPGGIGEFDIQQNKFLVFEKGPSVSLKLQWARYRDAADQCSLSRIWGGIHPSIDDIPGRLIGRKVGEDAFNFGRGYFMQDQILNLSESLTNTINIFPNPSRNNRFVNVVNESSKNINSIIIFDVKGRRYLKSFNLSENGIIRIDVSGLDKGVYILNIKFDDGDYYRTKFLIAN